MLLLTHVYVVVLAIYTDYVEACSVLEVTFGSLVIMKGKFYYPVYIRYVNQASLLDHSQKNQMYFIGRSSEVFWMKLWDP